MPRPALVVLGWLAATAIAVGVAYAGVSAVAGRVVDPLPGAIGLPDTATPTDAATASTEPSPTVRTTPSPTTSPPGTSQSPSPAEEPATEPPLPTADPPDTTTSPAAPDVTPEAEVRSYALVGGRATLRYEPGRVTVVSATPAQGYAVDVEGDGTAEVTVDFDSEEHRSRLRGRWEDGPEERIEEDDRGDDESDGGEDGEDAEDESHDD